jgi:prepilin-type N-terminal cleavage/methylation domain-containing protein
MILHRLHPPSGGQRGFTIVEMLVSLALTGLIGLGATMASAQVLNHTSRNSDFTTASRQAMNAIYWVSRDAQMAQTIAGADAFPEAGDLVFSWTTWDNEVDRVVYTLADGRLRRQYSVDGEDPVETLVADYINPDPGLTGCVWTGGVLNIKITASVGQGDRVIDVTRTHNVTSRPNL